MYLKYLRYRNTKAATDISQHTVGLLIRYTPWNSAFSHLRAWKDSITLLRCRDKKAAELKHQEGNKKKVDNWGEFKAECHRRAGTTVQGQDSWLENQKENHKTWRQQASDVQVATHGRLGLPPTKHKSDLHRLDHSSSFPPWTWTPWATFHSDQNLTSLSQVRITCCWCVKSFLHLLFSC